MSAKSFELQEKILTYAEALIDCLKQAQALPADTRHINLRLNEMEYDGYQIELIGMSRGDVRQIRERLGLRKRIAGAQRPLASESAA